MISHFFRVRVSHFLQPKNAADILLVATGMTVLLTFQYISQLVGGFKHVLLSISYMGCHPPHWLIFFKLVKTTNQSHMFWIQDLGWTLSLFSAIPKNEIPKMAGHCHLALCCDPQWRVRWMRSSSASSTIDRGSDERLSQGVQVCIEIDNCTVSALSKACMASCLWSIQRGMSLAGLLWSLLWDRSSDSSTRLFAAMGHSDK